MRIALVGTGGTIASQRTDAGVVAQLTAAEILAALDPSLIPASISISPIDVGIWSSFALQLHDMRDIAMRAITELDNGATAVVVMHGTDSMEETSFLTDLIHGGDQPVVFTGAQLPADDPDGDGAANLSQALETASAPSATGRGALVVFNRRIWPARHVRKIHTSARHGFAVIGQDAIDLDQPATSPRSTLSGAREALSGADLPEVEVVTLVPGGNGATLQGVLERRPDGLVVQALGVGNASPADTEVLAALVELGVPVLLTSRVPAGAVRPVYGSGGGTHLAASGVMFAGRVSTWQARVLLATALVCAPHDPLAIVEDWLAATDSASVAM